MTSFEEARALVLAKLDELGERIDLELAIDDRATRAEPWGWVFFYNSRVYIETGSFRHALAGNGPFVVERINGSVHELATSRSIEEQLAELHLRTEEEDA